MKYAHFSKTDRMELSILLKKGYSIRTIAKVLEKNPSSVSREIKRNSVNGEYNSQKANHKSRVKRKHSKYQGMKIVSSEWMHDYIEEKMKIGWTPEEISGRLKRENNDMPVISAKSIYKYLYSAYGQYLCNYLVSKRYYPKKRRKKKSKRELIPDRKFIEKRPSEVNLRTTFGHLEGDTLGKPKGESQTLVGALERLSRFFMAQKVPRLKYSMDGFKNQLRPYHKIIKSLTLDNGVENVRYQELNIDAYFCHPYSSWEKGSIENIFGRLRRYIPKKSSLAKYTDEQISAIIDMMNNTPRKCLNYATPKEVFEEHLALHLRV